MAKAGESGDTPEEAVDGGKSKSPVVEGAERKSKSAEPPASDNGEEDQEDDGDEGGEEEEYEIEAIIDDKKGYFERGEYGFLVKWKGYGSEHNSWVKESDAGNAEELIKEYWRIQNQKKKGARPSYGRGRPSTSNKPQSKSKSPGVESAKRVRGKNSRAKSAADNDSSNEDDDGRKKKKKRLNTAAGASKAANGSTKARASMASLNRSDDEDIQMKDMDAIIVSEANEKPYTTMKALKMNAMKNWEEHVKEVTTVELQDGELQVYFTTVDGKYVREPSKTCAKRFPQKMIQFYESHLRWKLAEEGGAADSDAEA